jgi:nicotinate phosphoribosyltransferase
VDANRSARFDDPGLLTAAQTSLLIDQYELAMAASYLERAMNQPAVFELSVRELPAGREWLLVAGLGPALRLVHEMRFADPELRYLESIGFRASFLDYLERFRFSGEIHAIPEGTVAFAGEPLVRVTAPRIEAQLLETLLLNQINFQTAIATTAARMVLAAGGGKPGAGERVVDFSPRRDHGLDAAMKAARSAAIAGIGSTSNVAAAMRYGLVPAGTMAHSYVMSFADERQAFEAFMQDRPGNTIMLVDTYDTADGVRHAIAAAHATAIPLSGVRLDSGDLLMLSRAARTLLDEAGMQDAVIVASGDLDEHRIARLVAAGAPIDMWGVGTELGVSREAPTLGGVYKLVADRASGGGWRAVAKRSPAKQTLPGAKQVFRTLREGVMNGDLVADASQPASEARVPSERPSGEHLAAAAAARHEGSQPLLTQFVDHGELTRCESLAELRARAVRNLAALPASLRQIDAKRRRQYSVTYSRAFARAARAGTGEEGR